MGGGFTTQQGIDVFLAVARLGSISAAAQALYITQPAVSRHLRALEEALGCSLVIRGRGQRREVADRDRTQALRVASVGSLVSYLLPPVFREFLAPGRALTFHNYHSQEAYDYVAQGLADIALISDHMYHPQVETIPAFRSAMVLLAGPELPWPERVHPSRLDPSRELRLPWNPEYDLWHSFWFSTAAVPRAVLDQMSLLEEFFSWQDSWRDSWAIAPALVAVPLSKKLGLTVRRIENGPADEIIYYLLGHLLGPRRKDELTLAFLTCLDRELDRRPEVESLLHIRQRELP